MRSITVGPYDGDGDQVGLLAFAELIEGAGKVEASSRFDFPIDAGRAGDVRARPTRASGLGVGKAMRAQVVGDDALAGVSAMLT